MPFVIGEATAALAIAEFIDLAGRARAPGQGDRRARPPTSSARAKKLANADFVARAPEEVVEENRERLAEAEAARDKLRAALARLDTVA